MEEMYSVCIFFFDNRYEYVRRYVPLDEAITAFKHHTSSVAVKIGFVQRVIMTDLGDCIIAEWINGKGLVYPAKESNG